MKKALCALAVALAASGGCSTESRVYRDQPLVAKVETGMSKEQVQQIGGQPQSISDRTVVPGTCFDYKLVQAGRPAVVQRQFRWQGQGRSQKLHDLRGMEQCTAKGQGTLPHWRDGRRRLLVRQQDMKSPGNTGA